MTGGILLTMKRTRGATALASADGHRDHVIRDGGYGTSYVEVDIDQVRISLTHGAPWAFDGPARETRTIGMVGVEVCTACLYTVTTCLHTRCTWRDTNTRLLCDLCGIDGT